MKNRTIAFGYLCQNGQIVINPSEAKTVNEIFCGLSQRKISIGNRKRTEL